MQYEVTPQMVIPVDADTPEDAAQKVLARLGLAPVNCQVREIGGSFYDVGVPRLAADTRSWWSQLWK
jgi:hypothetical protein